MARDEDEDDLYDDEFDFVDEDDDDMDEVDEESDLDDDESDIDSDSAVGEDADDIEPELDSKPALRDTVAKWDAREAYDDRAESVEQSDEADARLDDEQDEESVDDYRRPEPAANFRVHIYEYQQFKRTIDRPFTGEDAEAFASEYNRTSKSYGRFAVTGKDDVKPRKTLE